MFCDEQEQHGSSSGSWKKRFSLFSDSHNPSGASDDAACRELLLGQADGAAEQGAERVGSSSSSSSVWFDIGMSFCSEMDLPMRDDVDAEIAEEAKRLMKEEGR